MAEVSTFLIGTESINSLFTIQTALLKIWTDNNVDELYQKVFLAYLDTLSEE